MHAKFLDETGKAAVAEVQLSKDQNGRLTFKVDGINTREGNSENQGAGSINFTEPLTISDILAPLKLTVTKQNADGTIGVISSYQIGYISGNTNGTLQNQYSEILKGVRAYVITELLRNFSPADEVSPIFPIAGFDNYAIPFSNQYTPNQWLIGSTEEYASNNTMYSGLGGRKAVVVGNQVMEQLQGQPGIKEISLPQGFTSWDDVGKADFTLQRVAILDSTGEPVKAKPRSKLGRILGEKTVQESKWKLIGPEEQTEMGELFYPENLNSVKVGGRIKSETVLLTGISQMGSHPGFELTILQGDNPYGRSSQTDWLPTRNLLKPFSDLDNEDAGVRQQLQKQTREILGTNQTFATQSDKFSKQQMSETLNQVKDTYEDPNKEIVSKLAADLVKLKKEWKEENFNSIDELKTEIEKYLNSTKLEKIVLDDEGLQISDSEFSVPGNYSTGVLRTLVDEATFPTILYEGTVNLSGKKSGMIMMMQRKNDQNPSMYIYLQTIRN